MRAVFCLATAVSLGLLNPSAAQDRTAAPGGKAASGVGAAEPRPAASSSEKEVAAARSRNEARERGWDDRVKRTMRSICSGATGC